MRVQVMMYLYSAYQKKGNPTLEGYYFIIVKYEECINGCLERKTHPLSIGTKLCW